MQNVQELNLNQSPFENFVHSNQIQKNQNLQLNTSLKSDSFKKNNNSAKQNNMNNWQKAGTIAYCAYCAAMVGLVVVSGLSLKFIKNNFKDIKAMFSQEEPKKIIHNIYADLSKDKKISDISLPKSLENTTTEILNQIKKAGEISERGGDGSRSLLLYGPPGTGKTTYAKAITKEIPNAKFVSLDVTKMQSKWHGETAKNLHAMINQICSDAIKMQENYNSKLTELLGEDIIKSGDKKIIQTAIDKAKSEGKKLPEQERIIVFIDEIDSVMMVDKGANSKFSNDLLNEFKKAFTDKLAECDNVITIGATNLEIDTAKAALSNGKTLDNAMLDRFALKVKVPNPDKKQIKETIISHYKNATLAEQELKEDSSKLDELAEFLSKDEHNLSFRNLFNIFNKTANRTTGSKSKVSIEDIKLTLKEMSEELNMNEKDIDAICLSSS